MTDHMFPNNRNPITCVALIGSTGYQTFVDPDSDFHTVLQKCLWADILLLNPYSAEAGVRVRALSTPRVHTRQLSRLREDNYRVSQKAESRRESCQTEVLFGPSARQVGHSRRLAVATTLSQQSGGPEVAGICPSAQSE